MRDYNQKMCDYSNNNNNFNINNNNNNKFNNNKYIIKNKFLFLTAAYKL